MRALAEAVEHAGWDAVRCSDLAGAGPDCLTLAGALAAAVPRIRLDAVVRDAAGRHPAVVAKLASTVDQLSDGRLLLGLVPGADDDAEARLEEVFGVVKGLATEVRTTWRGHFYRLQDAPLDPKPRQQPFPVMLVGGSAELAARVADHWSIAGVSGELRSQLAALDAACRAAGRDRSTISLSAAAGDAPRQPVDGVHEWVVPDTALGSDPAHWGAALATMRAALGPT
jgi:alkanesulfonate monooxygenase SsuD/methylene tetrahydromethanopterin reductase-like flavin-dependent oxidoreductase (luciferase family)